MAALCDVVSILSKKTRHIISID